MAHDDQHNTPRPNGRQDRFQTQVATPVEKEGAVRDVSKALLLLIRRLVRHPDDVEVSYDAAADDRTYVIYVSTNDDDKGIVVGRDGTTIAAMELLLGKIAKKYSMHVSFVLRRAADSETVVSTSRSSE